MLRLPANLRSALIARLNREFGEEGILVRPARDNGSVIVFTVDGEDIAARCAWDGEAIEIQVAGREPLTLPLPT